VKLYFLGGSFNPPHLGHLKIAEFCLKQCNLFLFIPTYKSPFKLNQNIVSPSHRLNMLNLLIQKHDKIKVDSFEIEKEETSYTYKTVEYIKNKYNPSELVMIIGDDHLKALNKWKNIDYIYNNCKLICFNRNNIYTKKNLEIEFIKSFNFPISSSQIRNNIKQKNIRGIKNSLSSKLVDYILKNKLYEK